MRALIVAHDHVSPAGPIGERLEQLGYTIVEHLVVPAESYPTPGVAATFPEFRDFDVVVVLGAPWSVYDEERIGSWLLPEVEQVRRADAAGVPVLGICFGGQLLARAHGGSVELATASEIGWTHVESEDEDLVASGPWFEWHFDRWTPPPGATTIAHSERALQAFTLRRNLAVQFHPELTAESLRGWLDWGGTENARRAGYDPDVLVSRTEQLGAANRDRAHRLVDAFLDRVATTEAMM